MRIKSPRSMFPTTLTPLLVALASIACIFTSHAGTNSLTIPPALTGPVYDLTMDWGTTEFFEGTDTVTAGYNGNILGPTLIMAQGDFVTLNVENRLGERTTTHWHGMHVSPTDDGGPFVFIEPDETWSPDFEVFDTAATMWYHPHIHENTHRQVNLGLAGMLLVRDDVETTAGLPTQYGVDEFPLILQDKTFDETNQLEKAAFGSIPMVNATIDPYLEVPAQVVRFRVLNGANERGYYLGLTDDKILHIAGADGGLLDAPTPVNRIMINPGERLDILVDFSEEQGQSISLMSFAGELTPETEGLTVSPGGDLPLDGVDFTLVEFRVVAPTDDPKLTVPTAVWENVRIPEDQADRERTVRLTRDTGPDRHFTIDDQFFDGSRIDQVVLLGATEIWTLKNETPIPHPFHIHDIQFYVLDRDGEPPAPHEAGKKDTILVNGNETVRFITTFDDFADPTTTYMYHCHILPHEDAGMMGQFLVVDPSAPLLTPQLQEGQLILSWHKNLSAEFFRLQAGTLLPEFADFEAEPVRVNDQFQVTVPIDLAERYFRLFPVAPEPEAQIQSLLFGQIIVDTPIENATVQIVDPTTDSTLVALSKPTTNSGSFIQGFETPLPGNFQVKATYENSDGTQQTVEAIVGDWESGDFVLINPISTLLSRYATATAKPYDEAHADIRTFLGFPESTIDIVEEADSQYFDTARFFRSANNNGGLTTYIDSLVVLATDPANEGTVRSFAPTPLLQFFGSIASFAAKQAGSYLFRWGGNKLFTELGLSDDEGEDLEAIQEALSSLTQKIDESVAEIKELITDEAEETRFQQLVLDLDEYEIEVDFLMKRYLRFLSGAASSTDESDLEFYEYERDNIIEDIDDADLNETVALISRRLLGSQGTEGALDYVVDQYKNEYNETYNANTDSDQRKLAAYDAYLKIRDFYVYYTGAQTKAIFLLRERAYASRFPQAAELFELEFAEEYFPIIQAQNDAFAQHVMELYDEVSKHNQTETRSNGGGLEDEDLIVIEQSLSSTIAIIEGRENTLTLKYTYNSNELDPDDILNVRIADVSNGGDPRVDGPSIAPDRILQGSDYHTNGRCSEDCFYVLLQFTNLAPGRYVVFEDETSPLWNLLNHWDLLGVPIDGLTPFQLVHFREFN